MEIVKWPAKILNTKCRIVSSVKEAAPYIKDMKLLLQENDGLGLAAPQVGLDLRFFIAKKTKMLFGHEVFINPSITKQSSYMVWSEEECLSIPGVKRTILRPSSITVIATDEYGKKFGMDLEGLAARLICHENDHILGKTILDRE